MAQAERAMAEREMAGREMAGPAEARGRLAASESL